jgi:uncharacterized protein (DUF488 family)
MILYTIGHSTRTIEELIALLRSNGVATLADIRRYPASRRYPHFSRAALSDSLTTAGIGTVHLPELGGRRSPRPDSPNDAWRNPQFRAYADHMATPEFREGVEQLLALPTPTAILCSEAVPWRCHRFLVSDDLVRRGVEVLHIIGAGPPRAHAMNPAAVDRGGHLEYPDRRLPPDQTGGL